MNQFHSVKEDENWENKVRNQRREMFNVYATLLQSDLMQQTR